MRTVVFCVLAVLAACSIDPVTFVQQDAGPGMDADATPIDTVDAGPVTLMVSTQDMTIPEGEQSMLTVALSGPPTAATLVTVMTANDTKVGVVPTALLFQTTNWSVPQGVMITGKEDANVNDEQVNVAVISMDLEAILSVTVHITDNDELAIVTTPSTMVEISEGSSATVGVRLSAQPTGSLVVNVASANTGAATASPAAVTFSELNWNIDQNVTVTGVEDVNITNDPTQLNLTGTGVAAVGLALNVVDNDVLGIQVSTTNLGSIDEGSTGTTFTAQLTQLPLGPVTVNVASNNSLVATATPPVLTFTTANWNVPQTVSVDAPHDGDVADGATAITLMATGLLARSVAVSVTDDDVQALVATPNTVTVPEGGMVMFTVHLAYVPASSVTATVSSLNGTVATAGPATLTFTPANYATPQAVMVMGLQDLDAADTPTTIRLEDAAAGLLTNVPVTVVDDETLLIETSAVSVALGEASSTTFQARLSAMPTGPVTVNVSSGNVSAAMVGPATLTFTTANYMTYQTITVTGVQDDNLESEEIQLTLTASGIPSTAVTANVTDDDMQAVVVSTTITTVPEGGSGMVGVSLMYQPQASVTVTVMSANTSAVTATPATLTFTTTNYASPQNISIFGVQDADTVDSSTTVALTAPSATGAAISVTINDDDTLAIQTEVSAINVNEGGTSILRVRLSAQPAATTAVSIASSNTLAATVSPSSLSFTTANWMNYQDVTVSGLEDANLTDEAATVIVSSTGLGNVNVAVTVVDNDTQSISTTVGSVTVVEGTSVMFGVHLNAMPAGTVIVNVASADPTVATVSGALTFTPANYGADQFVTVAGVQDLDLVSEASVITLSSAGLVNRLVTANVTDDDVQRVVISPQSLTLNEGQSSPVMVSLAFQPANTVIVNMFSSNPAVANVAPAMVTFTTANYATPQNVVVNTLQDPDSTNGATTITGTLPGATTGVANVTVLDDDLVQIELDQTTMWVYENSVRSFQARLTAQPAVKTDVAFSTSDGMRANPIPKMLTFTTTNWNVYQPVQVFSGNDDDIEYENVRIDATGGTMFPRTVRVDVIDDDLLAVEPVYIDTCHGEPTTARVWLRGRPFSGPPHNGSLAVALLAGAYVNVGPPVMTFDQGNFSDFQLATMTSNYDDKGHIDQIQVTAPGQQTLRIDFTLRPGKPGVQCLQQ